MYNFGNATLSNLFSRVNEAIKTPRVIIFLHSLHKKVRKKRFCTSPKVASNVDIRILVLFCLRMSTFFQQGKLKKFKTGQLRCKCKYAELSCHKYVTAGFEICTFTILGVLTNNVWNTYNSWRTVCNINLDFYALLHWSSVLLVTYFKRNV